MLNEQLHTRFTDIVAEATKMVTSHVDKKDLAPGLDYASIYAQSQEEFAQVLQELKDKGEVALESSSGDYYKLNKPLSTPKSIINYCRVRVFDKEHSEKGYADFEVKNYQSFKNKYLSKPYFSLLNKGEEMIELRDPKFRVRAYFLNGNF